MPQWFYAHGDQQLGPVSDAEIKRLVADGSVRPQDEVWCEGMPDWKPAGEVRELFRERPLVPPPPPTRGGARNPLAALASVGMSPQLGKASGLLLVLVGFLGVIVAKGCDNIGARQVARAQARASQATADFNYEYESKKLRLETQREEINEKTALSEYDNERLNDIDKDLADLEEDQRSERRRLTRTTWRDLQYSADTAQANQQMWSYWNAIGFVLGSILLTFGLIINCIAGDVALRWLCLAMLAIVAFSLFIGRFA